MVQLLSLAQSGRYLLQPNSEVLMPHLCYRNPAHLVDDPVFALKEGKPPLQVAIHPSHNLEVISKPIFSVILNKPRELKLGKNHPPLF